MNCGYNCGYDFSGEKCFKAVPTGSFKSCHNDFQVFDVNGNVWEAVLSDSDSRGFEIRGGAFNCANPSERLKCTFNASWSALYAGFRCCKDR